MSRTIIAGSRSVNDMRDLEAAIAACGWRVSIVISGTAVGADRLGEEWGKANNIPVERFSADWDKYGKAAGYKRNEQMADKADSLIALWDGASRGTGHMIEIARRKGLRVYVRLVAK